MTDELDVHAKFQADCLNDVELGNLVEAYERLDDKTTHHAKQVGEKINKRLQQLWEAYEAEGK